MKIALIGYGKMGKAIETIASERGHEIVLKISSSNTHELTRENISKADVAIEFTSPHSAYDNISFCIDNGVPVVSGSTGWTERLEEIRMKLTRQEGSFLYASNFSVGVNIFFEINQRLARLMKGREGYDVQIEEIHHTAKKDAPSGTAITLAEQIIAEECGKTKWINSADVKEDELAIISQRIDPAPGTHVITWDSEIDAIEIRHTAHNRKGFAAGAVLAAEYIHDKKGIFNMKEVLGI